jgi:hypothetical protein
LKNTSDKDKSNSERTHKSANNSCAFNYSTQPTKEEVCEKEADTYLDDILKTHCVYAATVGARQIYTDQTGRFPVITIKGNTYIMVMYEYADNEIMVKPIKSRTSGEIL